MKIVLAAELNQVLRDPGPSTVAEFQAHLKDELACTTVLPMLQKPERKGYISHDDESRGHHFKAAIDQSKAQRSAVRDPARLRRDSAAQLLALPAGDENPSKEGLMRIRLLHDARQRGDKT